VTAEAMRAAEKTFCRTTNILAALLAKRKQEARVGFWAARQVHRPLLGSLLDWRGRLPQFSSRSLPPLQE